MYEDDEAPIPGTELAPYYAPETKAKAYELFLSSDMDFADIGVDLGVPSKVVASWSRKGKWLARREELERELMASAESKARAVILKNRVPVLERHLRVSALLEQAIEEAIANLDQFDVTKRSAELRRLTEAFSSAAGVSARAAGITDKPFTSAEAQSQGRQPLILLNVNPSPTGIRDEAPAITVQEVPAATETPN